MVKSHSEEYERVFIQTFVDWYNRKNEIRMRLLGPAKEVYSDGSSTWDWACRDAASGRELAIEVKRLEMSDRGEIEGPVLHFFRHEVGAELAGKIEGRYQLVVRHPGPPDLSGEKGAQLKRRVVQRILGLAIEMRQAPESERGWKDGDLDLTLIKLGSDENEWRCNFQFSAGYIWTQYVMDHTVRSGLTARNQNLRRAKQRGMETILVVLRLSMPSTYGADLAKSFAAVEPKDYRYIDHAYTVGWDNEVREIALAPVPQEQPREKRFKILITNDDGIYAKGLWSLAEALLPVGDVVVVAPDREQSGVGTAVTLHSPVRVNSVLPLVEGVQAYSAEGTPADCVILGLGSLVKDGVGLVISGINEGANLGNDVLISGTIGGAFQGCFHGLPAIAISLSTRGDVYHFEGAQKLAVLLAEAAKRGELPTGVVLNVNVPNAPYEQFGGIEMTRLALRSYQDLVEERDHGRGRIYHWIMRGVPEWTEEEGTDLFALRRRKVSVTPLHSAMTSSRTLKSMDGWGQRLFEDLKNMRELEAPLRQATTGGRGV